ncbi:MAG: BlaI/MecI/CopY family transcriptional regulator, partial [Oscillibacter sp.]|nr:BlaI/MecI/CopY family transcriptional regulator [Oscillibacter sp.]
RMTEKGVVRCEEREGVKVYFPLVLREEAALRETDSFLDRVYRGSVSMMVSAMTEKKALSRAEIDALYAILKEADGKVDGDD